MTESAGAVAPSSLAYRVFLVAFGMVQITLGAGLIVGWAGIAGSVMVEPVSKGGAGLTLDETTQMFGLAASINYISPLFLGTVLDKGGPRSASVLSNFLVAVGCFIFASSTDVTTLTVGLCFIAFGGPAVQTSLIHIGNMFPERRFFVMGVVAESITLSFAIFPFMDAIYESTPLGFRDIFTIHGILVTISTIFSFFLWPDSPYETPPELPEHPLVEHVPPTHLTEQPLDSYLRETGGKLKPSVSFVLSERGLDQADAEKHELALQSMSLMDLPFSKQLSSGVFIRLSIFFLVTSYWANFYIATVTTELGDKQDFDAEEQHMLAEQLSFIDAGAIICAPLSGYLLDSVGFAPTAFIAIGMAVLQMLLLQVADASESIMVLSFCSYAVYRAFLFPYFFASLSKKIGFKYFGILSGIAFSVSGISQLAISPLATYVEGDCHELDDQIDDTCSEGSWDMIHYFQIMCLVVLLLVPIIDNYVDNKKTKALKKLLSMQSSSYGSVNEVTELLSEKAQIY